MIGSSFLTDASKRGKQKPVRQRPNFWVDLKGLTARINDVAVLNLGMVGKKGDETGSVSFVNPGFGLDFKRKRFALCLDDNINFSAVLCAPIISVKNRPGIMQNF